MKWEKMEQGELTIYAQKVNSVNEIPETPYKDTLVKVPENQLTELTKLTISEDAEGMVYFEDTVDIKAFYGKPCPVCGGNDFYPLPDGSRVCNRCHPKPRGRNN